VQDDEMGETMSTTAKTASPLLDVRIILSGLWAARMLSGLQGDTFRLSDPVALQSILRNDGAVSVSTELLVVMSLIFVVPILMSFLTLILKYPVNRWANRILGIFFAVFDLVFLGLALFQWDSVGYEIVWSVAYLVCTTLIVWYAWRWTKPSA
jgi:Family of unknown function (DUF6326)